MSNLADRLFEESVEEEELNLTDLQLLSMSIPTGIAPVVSQPILASDLSVIGANAAPGVHTLPSVATLPLQDSAIPSQTLGGPSQTGLAPPGYITPGLGGPLFPPPISSGASQIDLLTAQMSNFLQTMQLCMPALVARCNQPTIQPEVSASASNAENDKILPMDADSVEKRVQLMPVEIVNSLAAIIPSFFEDMSKSLKANDRVDWWSQKHMAFIDGHYPSGFKPYNCSTETTFQTIWSEVADADSQAGLVIPHGTTRGKAIELISLYQHELCSRIELEAAKEARDTLEVASKKALLTQLFVDVGRDFQDKQEQHAPSALEAPSMIPINLRDLEVYSEVIYRVLYRKVLEARVQSHGTQPSTDATSSLLASRPTDLLTSTIKGLIASIEPTDPHTAQVGQSDTSYGNKGKGKGRARGQGYGNNNKRKWDETSGADSKDDGAVWFWDKAKGDWGKYYPKAKQDASSSSQGSKSSPWMKPKSQEGNAPK
jgi:desulfoferrodoxin (superoxide reductase-like protein)